MFFFSSFFLQFLSFLFYFILFYFFLIDFLKRTSKLYMCAQNNQPSSILRAFLGVATLNYTFITAWPGQILSAIYNLFSVIWRALSFFSF